MYRVYLEDQWIDALHGSVFFKMPPTVWPLLECSRRLLNRFSFRFLVVLREYEQSDNNGVV